ncbi:uncharacterized protein EV420DRAFT_1717449 [Desarmillaria tabescens]|uniref:DUF6532 domain-containing protein n=1 Tax=Armillaria tabescens TaxID=1929756 RepID=A0AA39JQL9_ARMTA|nr:uncharacterized protein EV420DRAFT_1717449 [Desarmillaria tabescens]KAK0445689.1 hypothetical protein EV420DRAFT_1717449 [Desarmillaria tabescens]
MPPRSKKALDLPTGMKGKPVAHWMQLRNGNKDSHPGTVDDWENEDDVETVGEKLKKQAQKKADSTKLQVQRDKAKVDVAILEDTLRREDVARELTVNHPVGPKKHAPSARKRAVKDVQNPQLALTVSPPPSSQVLRPEISVTSANEETQELNQQNISCEEDPSTGACQVLVGSDGSHEESDEHIPHDKSGDHVNAELKDPTKLRPKPTSRPVKVSARTAIANSRSTNEGVATPKLSLLISGSGPKVETTMAPKHVLKRKSRVIDDAVLDKPVVLCSEDESISPEVQVPPTKKKKLDTKTTNSTKTAKPTNELAKNWEKKKSRDGPHNAGKKAGGMVEDDEDIKPEFVDIVKTKGNLTDRKPTGVVDVTVKIVKKEGPLMMTARQARGGKNKWTTNHLPDGTQDAFSKWIVPYLREKVGQSVTPWASLSVEDVQEAVDIEFGRTEYCVAEKGAWMSLANYRITNFRHDICVEAEKAVEAFIKEHSDQLSTPELIGQYMAYLITSTSPEGNVSGPSPPFMWKVWKNDGAKRRGIFCHELIIRVMAEAHFMALGPMNNLSIIPYPKGALLLTGQAVERAISMWTTGVFVNTTAPTFSRQNFDNVTEEFALNPAERAKYGKDARKKSVKTKRVSIYQATLDSWNDAKWIELLTEVKQAVETSTSKKRRKMSTSAWSASPDIIEQEADIVFRSDPPDPDSDEDSGDCGGSVGTVDESAEEDNVAGSVTVTATPSDADGLSDSESVMAVD